MNNIIEKMCVSDNLAIIKDLEDIVHLIAVHEYPHNWKNALIQIGDNLGKEDEQLLYGSLCALKGIVKRFKTKTKLEWIHLHEIAAGAFPVIEGIIGNIIASHEEKDLILMAVMFKIFYLANYVVKSI